jgi:hypothetical protein
MTLEQALQAHIDHAFRNGVIVPCPGVACGYAAAREPSAQRYTIVCGWCMSRYELEEVEGVRLWQRRPIVPKERDHA